MENIQCELQDTFRWLLDMLYLLDSKICPEYFELLLSAIATMFGMSLATRKSGDLELSVIHVLHSIYTCEENEPRLFFATFKKCYLSK